MPKGPTRRGRGGGGVLILTFHMPEPKDRWTHIPERIQHCCHRGDWPIPRGGTVSLPQERRPMTNRPLLFSAKGDSNRLFLPTGRNPRLVKPISIAYCSTTAIAFVSQSHDSKASLSQLSNITNSLVKAPLCSSLYKGYSFATQCRVRKRFHTEIYQ